MTLKLILDNLPEIWCKQSRQITQDPLCHWILNMCTQGCQLFSYFENCLASSNQKLAFGTLNLFSFVLQKPKSNKDFRHTFVLSLAYIHLWCGRFYTLGEEKNKKCLGRRHTPSQCRRVDSPVYWIQYIYSLSPFDRCNWYYRSNWKIALRHQFYWRFWSEYHLTMAEEKNKKCLGRRCMPSQCRRVDSPVYSKPRLLNLILLNLIVSGPRAQPL